MLQVFIVGFVFSFIGSVPPGTLNLSVIQLSLNGRYSAALRFSLAAAIIEYPYALVAIHFEALLLKQPLLTQHFELVSAIVMLVLGAVSLNNARHPSEKSKALLSSGFRQGILLSMLNPLAIPFWIGVTAYLRSVGWVYFPESSYEYIYVFGISLGTLALLALLAALAQKAAVWLRHSQVIKAVPGIVFLVLGLYALGSYLLSFNQQ